MKKQSASTIKIFSIDDVKKKDAIERIKAALISLGLRYVPENEDKKNTPSKEGVHQVLLILDISYISFLQGKIARRL